VFFFPFYFCPSKPLRGPSKGRCGIPDTEAVQPVVGPEIPDDCLPYGGWRLTSLIAKGERMERERRGGDRRAQRERVKLSQHDLTITRKPHCSSRAMPSLDHAGSFTLSLGHFTQLTPHHSSDRLPRRDRQLAQHTIHMAIDPAAASFLYI
jgi:hypothetical protein